MEDDASQIHTRFPTHATRGSRESPVRYPLGGYHPLRRAVPGDFGYTDCGSWPGRHHMPAGLSHAGSVCSRPLSIASTCGITRWSLFLRLLRCFSSAGYLSRMASAGRSLQDVPFGDPRFEASLQLPLAYRGLARPSSASEPSHPPDGGVATTRPLVKGRLAPLSSRPCAYA